MKIKIYLYNFLSSIKRKYNFQAVGRRPGRPEAVSGRVLEISHQTHRYHLCLFSSI